MDYTIFVLLLIFFCVCLSYLVFTVNRKKEELNWAYDIQKAIFDSTHQSIIITNSNGMITSFNKGAESMLGYQAEEVINKMSIIHLYDPEFLQKKAKISEGGIQHTELSFDILVSFVQESASRPTEWLMKCKDGSLLPYLQSVIEIRDSNALLKGFLFMGTDITERKMWEHDLIVTREAVANANRSKSQFLAHVSHDLRTPLNSIIGFTNVLLKNRWGNLNEQQISYLHKVTDNGQFLLRLINEILDLNKIETSILQPNFVPTNLATLITTILNRLEGRVLDRQLKLVADVPPNLNPLLTDPEKLEDVLVNLISNAIKYTKQGTVTVSVKVDEQTQEAYQIDITDTGIGIEDYQINKIFKPFYQISSENSRNYGSGGLGLSIVWSLCEVMGYHIKVSSQFNKGSTFSIILDSKTSILPLEIVKQAAEKPSLNPINHLVFPDFNILVIEDNVEFKIILTQAFEKFGCTVFSATTGFEGLKLAKEHPIDLITMEMLITPMNGYDVIKALQEDPKLKNIPFVLITLVAKEVKDKIPDALAILNKPPSLEDLRRTLYKCYSMKKGF